MIRNRLAFALLAPLLFAACPVDGGPDGGEDDDAGVDGGGGGDCDAFCTQELEGQGGGAADGYDGGQAGPLPLEAVLLPNDTVGVAYFHKTGDDAQGNAIYQLRYRTWQNGTVSAPEAIDTVQRVVGLGMGVSPDGIPAVSYLGGDDPTTEQAFWWQNDAYLAHRTGGSWQTTVVAQESNEAFTGNNVSDLGFLVGLHSDVEFTGGDVFVVWRDCHNAQFPQQDWAGSDLEVARGTLTSFPEKRPIQAGDGDTVGKQGFSGHNRLVVGQGGRLAVIGDRILGGPDTIGQNPFVSLRNADGSWTPPVDLFGPVANTMTGAVLAYDATQGYYAAAVTDGNSNLLRYTRSTNGTTWNTPEQVVQSGTSGWYPSLAISPDFHEPHIAYYHCDNRTNIAAHQCRESDDELRIEAKIGSGAAANWQRTVVDRAGGWSPKLLFLSNGKRVVVYRDPRTYAVKLAREP